MYSIYMHKNKQNGKVYIGVTKRNPSLRWGKNGNGYKDQPKFFNAITKYGWDNFEHIILDYCETEDEALFNESQYIKKYNSIENGYNILSYGIKSYTENNKKPVICLTTGEIFSSIWEAAKAKNIKANGYPIIQNCKGKSGVAGGLEWAYWDKENSCPIEKPKFEKNMTKIFTPVYCIELDRTYPSVIDAEEKLHLAKGCVEKAINKHRNGAGGWHFIKETDKNEELMLKILQTTTGKSQKIVCLETNQVFSSLQTAGDFCKRSAQSVMLNCQNKRKSCGQYHFQYLKDFVIGKTLKEVQNLNWGEE